MARRKKRPDGGSGYNWMDTYGDMVTLLLTFFIMLFSMSTVNEEKWEILVRAFSKNPDAATAQIILVQEGEGDDIAPANGVTQNIGDKVTDNELPTDLNQLYEYLKQYVEENQMTASVSISKDSANNVYIRFDNNIFFSGDSYTLRQESFPILDFLGDCLKNVEDQIFVTRVNGHTAAIPGAENYHISDWTLSGERASQVVIYFEENSDLDPKKLMCNGYGKNYPIESNDTPEGRAKNRRVEIMVLGNSFDKNNPEDLYSILSHLVSAELFEDNSSNTEILNSDKKLFDENTPSISMPADDITANSSPDNT
ncbi:flagellar motor protein MotB [Oscillospiraceae bacterium LTW-04]|nr:flagellar motor protein MotB [Oscillospiraceae bacterium MB24-C1]